MGDDPQTSVVDRWCRTWADLAIANAIVYGLVAGVIAEFWLIPLLSQRMARHTEPLQLIVGHVIFGFVLGIVCNWLAEH